MRSMLRIFWALPILLAGGLWAAGPVAAESLSVSADARKDLSLTIYNQDLGLVRENREVAFKQGDNALALEDVSARLRPETVILRGEGLQTVEQTFSFDLLTQQNLLDASVGKKVWLSKVDPKSGKEKLVEATLLSNAQGPVLRVGERIVTAAPDQVVFEHLPANLRAAPALLAVLNSDAEATRDLEIQYLTSGLSWRADYVAELNTAEDQLDLTALMTLTNATNGDFPEAKVRLVAGQVNQARPRPMPQQRSNMLAMAEAAPAGAPQVQAQAVSDRYIYDLEKAVTLLRRETKQVPLFTAPAVKVKRIYRFENAVQASRAIEEIGPLNADIVLEMENSKAAGLGKPLPAGVVRVYQLQTDGAPVFAGESSMRHTAEGETVELTLGQAFDITAVARLKEFRRISNSTGAYEMGQTITVKNAKDKAVEVEVIGNMPRGWNMLKENAKHEKLSANRLLWTLKVPAKGEATLDYELRVKP